MQVLHPEFDPNSSSFDANLDKKILNSRRAQTGIVCCPVAGQPSWGETNVCDINYDISHLNDLHLMSSKAKTCNTISCSWNAAIWVYNDVCVPSSLLHVLCPHASLVLFQIALILRLQTNDIIQRPGAESASHAL